MIYKWRMCACVNVNRERNKGSIVLFKKHFTMLIFFLLGIQRIVWSACGMFSYSKIYDMPVHCRTKRYGLLYMNGLLCRAFNIRIPTLFHRLWLTFSLICSHRWVNEMYKISIWVALYESECVCMCVFFALLFVHAHADAHPKSI